MDIEKAIKEWKDGNGLCFNELSKMINALIEEREQKKPKKWEPEGGVFHVGERKITQPINCVSVLRGDHGCDFSSGRYYHTQAQAEEAKIFQRRAMRFFRWAIEQKPDLTVDDLYSFQYLLPDELEDRLMILEDSGEVEF